MKFLCACLAVLFLLQRPCLAQATDETARMSAPKDAETQPAAAMEEGAPPPAEEYDVINTIERGKQTIRDQKAQLISKELPTEKAQKTEDEVQKTEEETLTLRREVYRQQIIQEVENPSAADVLESELRKERFRQELMTSGGKAPAVTPGFKKRKFQLKLSEACDDNIYLDKIDRKKDYINKLSPSFLFSFNTRYVATDTNYVADYTYYTSDKNKKQNGLSQLLYTRIRPSATSLPFLKGRGGRFGIEIENTFQPRVTSISGDDQTSRTKKKINKLLIPLDFYLTRKLTLSLEYLNNYVRYIKPEDQYQGYTENAFSPKVFFHIRPKWSLFGTYTYGVNDYPKYRGADGDSVYHKVSAGLTGTLLAKVRSRFELGNEWRDWEKSPVRGNADKIFFKAALVNRFSPSTKGILQYSHQMLQTTSVDEQTPFYVVDRIYAYAEHKITNRITGILSCEYYQDDYNRHETVSGDTRIRLDKMLKPQIGVKYYFKEDFFMDVWYNYAKRTSNFNTNDYVDNKVTVGLNAPF